MKRGALLCGTTKPYKLILLVFAIFFLVCFITSAPAKMKRLALTPEWSTGIDSILDLAFDMGLAADPAVPQIAGLITLPNGNIIITRVIVSCNIYRGPPALSL